MSDDLRRPDDQLPDDQLPDDRLPEDRLPQDLAAIEARLAAHALPAPALNRDELLYQAGWAACEAKLNSAPTRLASSPRPLRQPSRTTAAWSAASAALAASLAVAATLALTSNRAPRGGELAVDSRTPVTIVADDATSAESPDKAPTAAAPRDDVARVLASVDAMLRSDRADSSGSLVTALGGARRLRWDEPVVATVERDASTAAPAATTTRGLLDELLPGSRSGGGAPSALPWFQRFTTSGEETI